MSAMLLQRRLRGALTRMRSPAMVNYDEELSMVFYLLKGLMNLVGMRRMESVVMKWITEGGLNAILNTVARTIELDNNFRSLTSNYTMKSELY
jgi:hypothetical protein